MIWIKICGNTNVQDAQAAVSAGANAIGFIFAPGPRRIAPLDARNIVTVLPATLQRVGVFVNETPERVREIAGRAKLTAVQLHGNESPDYVRGLFRDQRALAVPPPHLAGRRQHDTRIFKVVTMDSGAEEKIAQFTAEPDLVDGILLDSCTHVRGGSGQPFDWQAAAPMVQRFEGKTRFIIAGGLSAANVGDAVRTLRPWGVDVVTSVERQPGIKDHPAVRAFVDQVRAAEAQL
jgi:phosphoribosylanthranilate isomerase